jgi:hypothetical protein
MARCDERAAGASRHHWRDVPMKPRWFPINDHPDGVTVLSQIRDKVQILRDRFLKDQK